MSCIDVCRSRCSARSLVWISLHGRVEAQAAASSIPSGMPFTSGTRVRHAGSPRRRGVSAVDLPRAIDEEALQLRSPEHGRSRCRLHALEVEHPLALHLERSARSSAFSTCGACSMTSVSRSARRAGARSCRARATSCVRAGSRQAVASRKRAVRAVDLELQASATAGASRSGAGHRRAGRSGRRVVLSIRRAAASSATSSCRRHPSDQR